MSKLIFGVGEGREQNLSHIFPLNGFHFVQFVFIYLQTRTLSIALYGGLAEYKCTFNTDHNQSYMSQYNFAKIPPVLFLTAFSNVRNYYNFFFFLTLITESQYSCFARGGLKYI